MVWSSGLRNRIPETDSRGPEAKAGSLDTELGVHRMHDTLEAGLQMKHRSVVAPHKEGLADELFHKNACKQRVNSAGAPSIRGVCRPSQPPKNQI